MKSNTTLKQVQFRINPTKEHFAYSMFRQLKKTTLRKHSRSNGYKITIGDKEITLWSLKTADSKFSSLVRERDKCCQRCGTTENLTNSHFHGRSHSGTRFYLDNCDIFCLKCHWIMETRKNYGEEYYMFKLYQLGQEKFDALKVLANKKYSRMAAIKDCMGLINKINTINSLREIQI